MREDQRDKNGSVLRLFERELDAFHKSFPIMVRAPEAALYGVMAAYDSMLLVLREISARIDDRALGSRQAMRAIVQSINPALYWITEGRPPSVPNSSMESDLIDEGGNLLNHARDYLIVSIFHVMYSRRLMNVECDKTKRLVRFVRLESQFFPDGFASAVIAQSAARQDQSKRTKVISDFNTWLMRVTYTLANGRIEFKKTNEFASRKIVDVARLFIMPETLELPDDINLMGFTMGQFRRFWTALHCWSITATELYMRLVENGVAQERCMPTQILSLSDFLEAMRSLTELEPEVISEITSRLTYNTINQKRDAFLQPLLVSQNRIAWCPLLVKQSRPERNMLKLMSRTPPLSNVAATIIGGREGQMLKEFGLRLAKRGYDYKLNTTMRWGGQMSELDLLAYNRKTPDELLLVEAKAVLAVDDVAEVQSATEQLRKAARQLKRSISILNAMPLKRKNTLFPFVNWERAKIYRRLVMTPDSSPLGEFSEDDVSVITLELLRTQFRNRDLKTPTAIWEACRTKNWLKPFKIDGEDYYSSMKIGSITYEFPAREQTF